jgi:predicted metal-dependent hydrolase
VRTGSGGVDARSSAVRTVVDKAKRGCPGERWTPAFVRPPPVHKKKSALRSGYREQMPGSSQQPPNAQLKLSAAASPAPRVEVRRSRRRKRTVSAFRNGDSVVVLIPASLSRSAEQRWVDTMLDRLERQEQRRSPGDEQLMTRTAELSARYLDRRARPASVRWVDNQATRWGSCTPADGSVRLSTRLRGMPVWVLDYVLLHELAHLLEPGHTAAFWALVNRYPKSERARGFLAGADYAAARLPSEHPLPEPVPDQLICR